MIRAHFADPQEIGDHEQRKPQGGDGAGDARALTLGSIKPERGVKPDQRLAVGLFDDESQHQRQTDNTAQIAERKA